MTFRLSRKRPAEPSARAQARRLGVTGLAAVGASAAVAALAAAPSFAATTAAPNQFKVINLVSDIPGLAPTLDANLVNPWGTSELPDGPLWVSDQGSGNTSVYVSGLGDSGLLRDLTVSIPGGNATGQVFNPGFQSAPSNFVVRSGNQSGPAAFIFASLTGQISAWNPNVGIAKAGDTSTRAFGVVASVRNASFTGLAISGSTLYAANFGRGTIDVFNSSFRPVFRLGAFTDFAIPRAFRPFNVQNLGGSIYVTYARPDPRTGRAGNSLGAGYVDVFSPQGVLQKRLISGGLLDSPWGLTIAPPRFGAFSSDLLVGNFGDGFINAYNPRTGRFVGALRDARGGLVHEDHLWSLIVGTAEASNRALLFTAGIDNERHGLVGAIVPAG
jgi:uncharacterized protein (TIGR03118 family)